MSYLLTGTADTGNPSARGRIPRSTPTPSSTVADLQNQRCRLRGPGATQNVTKKTIFHKLLSMEMGGNGICGIWFSWLVALTCSSRGSRITIASGYLTTPAGESAVIEPRFTSSSMEMDMDWDMDLDLDCRCCDRRRSLALLFFLSSLRPSRKHLNF